MAKCELKTKRTDASVTKFIDGIQDEKRKRDSFRVLEVMKTATGAEPKMWGSSIVGFGDYTYPSAGGKQNEWFLTGFSPRKQALTVYMMTGYAPYPELMKRLGKHKTGGSCLYIKDMDDIDPKVLGELIKTGSKAILQKKVK